MTDIRGGTCRAPGDEKLETTPLMEDVPQPRPSSQPAASTRDAWSPEARLLVWCARTTVPESVSMRIRETAGGQINWPLVLDLAWFHGVGTLMHRTLSSVCADLVPSLAMNALRQRSQAEALANRALTRELTALYDAFKENGVPVIAFKGATLAAVAYGNIELRDFGDLDFIVPQRRLADAQRVLWSKGYRPQDASRETFHQSHADEPYHLFVKKNVPGYVDLQWVMAHEAFAFRLDRPDIWDRRASVSVDGKSVCSLAVEELLIVLCVHGSKHAWERLKWVVDVAELLRANRLDWKRVFAMATAWRCRRMVLLGLALAHRLMQVPLPSMILNEFSADADIPELAWRMPQTLLVRQEEGIGEEAGPALYYSLKDSCWDRWRYALTLLRHDHPILRRLPDWFRSRGPLSRCAKGAVLFRASRLFGALKRTHSLFAGTKHSAC
ncbi:MAG TPA: nucleotidyltransferase family protein [Nitrospira sp.]|nr:nucleotidyltransferase family protein [Nitrospira sp.]